MTELSRIEHLKQRIALLKAEIEDWRPAYMVGKGDPGEAKLALDRAVQDLRRLMWELQQAESEQEG